jgi:CheY-like chemotaxis protein/nitrogen-specific signal transduction histidine kinase
VLWHGYWADVTSRRELEDQLVSAKDRAERASQAKSDFLAAMSHEIRTPMTGVVGMVELLALEELRDEQRLSVGIIRESSAALLRIIDDVLDWSRIEAGKFELRMAPATLDAIVARVAGLYAAVATNKGLRLERTLDPSLRDAYMVDAVRVQQVLSNLISNAVKFTDRGEVRVGLALIARGPRADIVAFDVCDTGAGISAEDQSRLFAAYSQVGDAAARTGGTGLGLSISRRLAELMGGSLSLESKPGGGTRARLVLPVSHAHRAASPAAPGDRPLCLAVDNSGRPRILLIDDDEVTRVVMQRQLAALGYVVEATSSAQEALQRCESTRFAAILVDCSMPSMDGYEFTRRLRAREQQRGRRRTPVIACTACVFEEDVRASREAGMDDHLRKPTDLDQLGTMLRRWTAPPGEDTTHA